MTEYKPDYVSPPGETLEEILIDCDMSRAELAEELKICTGAVSGIIKGSHPITPRIAEKLKDIFGVSVEFWLAREKRYREHLLRKASQERREIADLFRLHKPKGKS